MRSQDHGGVPSWACTVRTLWAVVVIGSMLLASVVFASPDAAAAPAPPIVSLEFQPDTVLTGAPTTLTISIDNTANVSPVDDIKFSTSAIVGLGAINGVTSTCGGTGWNVSSGSFNTSNRSVTAGEICAFSIDTTITSTGRQTVSISDFISEAGASGSASTMLTVTEAPLGIDIEIAPDPVAIGEFTDATITIDNTGNFLESTFSFSTSELAGVNSNTLHTTDCLGGGSGFLNGSFSVSNRGVPAGGQCSFVLRYSFSTVGDRTISVSDLAATVGTPGSASTTVTVTEAPLGVEIVVAPDPVLTGEFTDVTITIDNTANAASSTFSFSTSQLAGVSTNTHQASTCTGGPFSFGGGSFETSNRTVGAGAQCTTTLRYSFSTPGDRIIAISDLTATVGEPGSASTTFSILATATPVISIEVTPDPVNQGAALDAVITIDNTASPTLSATFGFSTSPQPAGTSVIAHASTCGGSAAGSSTNGSWSTSNRLVAAASSCALTLRFTFAASGQQSIGIDDFVSDLGSSIPTSTAFVVTAPATPTIALSFDPETIVAGETTRLSIDISNPSFADASNFSFSAGPLPGLPVPTGGCSNPGFALSGGFFNVSNQLVPAGSQCGYELDIPVLTPGEFTVLVDDFVSSLGSSATASSDALTVTTPPPLVADVSFDQLGVNVGEQVVATITADNQALITAADMSFSATGFSGMTLDDLQSNCTTTHSFNNGVFSLPAGSVSAESVCTWSLTLTPKTAGQKSVAIDDLISAFGASQSAGAGLEVLSGPVPTLSLEFSKSPVMAGRATDLRIVIDNTAGLVDATSFSFTSTQLGGVTLIGIGSTFCAGQMTFVDGVLSMSNGFVEAGRPCVINVALGAATPGVWDVAITNATSSIGSGSASASLTITAGVLCDGKTPTIYVTAGLTAVGTGGPDVIWGTDGADIIDSGEGNDTICANGGDDVVDAGGGNDYVLAGDGDDTVDGGLGDDVALGEVGNDTITGGDGDDSLFGNEGIDLIRGGPGIDTIEGGLGDDRLLGGTGGDTIDGGEGNDFIGGFGGDDIITGGPGNETIFGGFGKDTIDGGPGNDNIRGLIGDDIITGGEGDDKIFGDKGNDVLSGGLGDDIVDGGNAEDQVNGNGGDDTLSGGKRDDVLNGGPGTDVCIGNAELVADTAINCETEFGIP